MGRDQSKGSTDADLSSDLGSDDIESSPDLMALIEHLDTTAPFAPLDPTFCESLEASLIHQVEQSEDKTSGTTSDKRS